jgi:hypothetical protein
VLCLAAIAAAATAATLAFLYVRKFRNIHEMILE